MAATFRFIASPEEGETLLKWFSDLPEAPTIYPRRDGAALFFRQFGPLVMTAKGDLDATRSPIVLVVLPQVRHGVLWTAGEVQFRTERMRDSFPGLGRVLARFRAWAKKFPSVFRVPRLPEKSGGEWDYYLEGSIRNVGDELFALPNGMAALERGQYFVWQGDTEGRLDTVLRMLRLRGVVAAEPGAPPNAGDADAPPASVS